MPQSGINQIQYRTRIQKFRSNQYCQNEEFKDDISFDILERYKNRISKRKRSNRKRNNNNGNNSNNNSIKTSFWIEESVILSQDCVTSDSDIDDDNVESDDENENENTNVNNNHLNVDLNVGSNMMESLSKNKNQHNRPRRVTGSKRKANDDNVEPRPKRHKKNSSKYVNTLY